MAYQLVFVLLLESAHGSDKFQAGSPAIAMGIQILCGTTSSRVQWGGRPRQSILPQLAIRGSYGSFQE
jgi:hypothetical protein